MPNDIITGWGLLFGVLSFSSEAIFPPQTHLPKSWPQLLSNSASDSCRKGKKCALETDSLGGHVSVLGSCWISFLLHPRLSMWDTNGNLRKEFKSNFQAGCFYWPPTTWPKPWWRPSNSMFEAFPYPEDSRRLHTLKFSKLRNSIIAFGKEGQSPVSQQQRTLMCGMIPLPAHTSS